MKVGTWVGVEPAVASGWWRNVPAAARRADELGYDFVSCDESQHDSMLTMTLAAANSERVELQTAVTVAFPRSPMILAMQAWDLQQLSKGRFILGLGCSVKDDNERRFGLAWSPPAPRMKEYIQCLHAIWDTFQNSTEPNFSGKHYRFELMPDGFNPGPSDFPRPKVFLAAIGDAMGRVAGEVADGVIFGGFMTEKYLREVYLENVKVGLERAGRTWNDIEIPGGPVSVFDDSESETQDAALGHAARLITNAFSISPYFVTVRDKIFELHGWHELAERLHALAAEGEHEEMQRILPEEVIRAFIPLTVTPDRLSETLSKHREFARRIHFSMPTGTPAERERFQHILNEIQGIETSGVPAGLGL
ncbi:MAG: TIGR03617 family F420-dependent LLM class oxidoreductase [Gammaproteobacteria bacterium]|nr:TIGR03617 family F420-dependent LLM class oxidoreductase [Gammaproteobacteria bacterium]